MFGFYRKRGLGLDQSHYNQSRLWSRLHTTLAQISRKWIYSEDHPKVNMGSPPSEYTFNTLYWKIFHRSGFSSNLLLPWKTQCAVNSLYWIYIFLLFRFLSNLLLPWKAELHWNFSLYWNIFYHSGFLINLRLSWKQSLPRNFSNRGLLTPHSPASYTYGFASTRTKCPEYANLEKCRRGRLARRRIPIIKFGPTCKNFGHFCFSTTLSRLIYTLTDFVRKKNECTFYTQTSLNIDNTLQFPNIVSVSANHCMTLILNQMCCTKCQCYFPITF